MAEVKPDEVSAILRQQLAGFKSDNELEEVGTILQIGDGIARIYGLTKVQSGELIECENGLKGIVLNLEEDNVGAVLLGSSEGIKEGNTVKRTRVIASVMAGHLGMSFGKKPTTTLENLGSEILLETLPPAMRTIPSPSVSASGIEGHMV